MASSTGGQASGSALNDAVEEDPHQGPSDSIIQNSMETTGFDRGPHEIDSGSSDDDDSDDDDDGNDADFEDDPVDYDEDDMYAYNLDDDDGDIDFGFSLDDLEEEEDEDEESDEGQGEVYDVQELIQASQTGTLNRAQLLYLFQNGGIRRQIFDDHESEWDSEMGYIGPGASQPSSVCSKDSDRFPEVPSEEGRKLMNSGWFGVTDEKKRTARHLNLMLLEREIGPGSYTDLKRLQGVIAQSLLPTSRVDKIIQFHEPVYSGQFSSDGNFFYACSQDFKVRLYDTANPHYWRPYKTLSYPMGQWTLTDATLSRDNQWIAFTSIQSLVSIAPTDPDDTGDPYTLQLGHQEGEPDQGWRSREGFGIWSIRFSEDGRELIAGTNNRSLVIYDIQARKVLNRIEAHDDDVNAVCFADKLSPHIIYSGSDDTTIKVWDRRSMGDGREVAAFVGHIEGLTYIDSKGDGRYILSNGKDQSMKLWDLRMAMSTTRFRELERPTHLRDPDFDYRSGRYSESEWDVHPHDNSVVTFRGHRILRTLIRCHFSPPHSSNSRYVYSGSADGKVYIWNIDATEARRLNVKKATMFTRPFDSAYAYYGGNSRRASWRTIVRDASWHPNAPMIVASALNGYNMSHGTCTIHSFSQNGGGEEDDDEAGCSGHLPLGSSVNEMLQPHPSFFKSKLDQFDETEESE